MPIEVDLAVIGSGLGGSLISMIAKRIGLSMVLLERGSHPRFAIGESTSPLMNLIIEQIAQKYDLPRLLPLTTYGSWQKQYPEVTCGLKRGFTYYHHEAGSRYNSLADRSNQLMVAASPRDEIGDTHWLRSDVDAFLVHEAKAIGVEYLDHVQLSSFTTIGKAAILAGEQSGQPLEIKAKFVIDASSPRGFLSRALNISEGSFTNYPPTQSLFSHFTGVKRCDTMDDYQTEATPPYPSDEAALHHVFDGGWMWVLRFNNGVTSAGVAVEDWLAKDLNLREGEKAWPRFLNRFPSIAIQFENATAVQPFRHSSRLAYKANKCVGENWAMLPSAAAFIDPLFSTGMPLTLLGIKRLGRIFEESWGKSEFSDRIRDYGRTTMEEADWTAQFISACYSGMKRFPLFSAFSMYYFTAASFAEMSRRVESKPRYSRYLASDSSQFAAGMRDAAKIMHQLAQNYTEPDFNALQNLILTSTEPLNIAGLCDLTKWGWYGVDLQDVIASSEKLGFSADEMKSIISNASWT